MRSYIGYIFVFSLAGFLFFSGCHDTSAPVASETHDTVITVTADVETAPMSDPGDAADDPAIWVHPSDPGKSLLIATNKKRGLEVYGLDGTLWYKYNVGKINNVDIRYGFPIGASAKDIVVGSNRTDNTLLVMTVDVGSGSLEMLSGLPVQSLLQEVYGCCLYHDQATDLYYAFLSGKEGDIEQWQLTGTSEGSVQGTLVRQFAFGSQVEGLVADDASGWLYVGEEDRGVWRVQASPDSVPAPILIDTVGGGHLVADVEGLALVQESDGQTYLVVSSQGNNSFALYTVSGKPLYLGSFTVEEGETIDGVSETDGIEVCAAPLGASFPDGILVVQDGENTIGQAPENQNFKIIYWSRISGIYSR
ncbi:MAG: phytase [Bacteroidales bacterium]|nr:phytase [Bacteroidales bacterium]